MPDHQVLRTKLIAPERHPLAVDRVAALDRIDAGLAANGSVVLSSLPGYARRDLLARWAEDRSPDPAAWLTLDARDDLARFVRHLVAALQRIEPALGQGMGAIVDRGPEAISTEGLMTLASQVDDWGQPITVVVLGLELVVDEFAQRGLGALHRNHPANVRLIWVSDDAGVDQFPASDGVTRASRLGAADLRFDESHLAAMLGAIDVSASASAIAEVIERSAGWPLVVLHAVDRAAATGQLEIPVTTEHELGDRIHRAVCAPLPVDLWSVVSDLAVVGSVSAARFADVTDRTEVNGALERLRLRHVAERVTGDWSVVAAVRDHLDHERSVMDATTAVILRRRVAYAMADEDRAAEALDLLANAGDTEAHARLLLERHRQWSSAGLECVETHATRALISDPSMAELHLVRAWYAVFNDDDATATAIVDGVERLPLSGPRRTRANSEVEMLRAILARRAGRLDDCMFHALACEALGSEVDRAAERELAETPYTAVFPGTLALYLGHCLFHAGELEDARVELLRASLAREWSPPAVAAMHGTLALIGWIDDDPSAPIHAAIAAAALGGGELNASNHFAGAALALLGPSEDAADMAARYCEAAEHIPEPAAAVLALLVSATHAASPAEARRSHAAARAAADRCEQPGVLSVLVARGASLLSIPDDSPELGEDLTDGERRVVRALRGDLTEREIAGELNLSHNTVRTYRRRAYRKLGVVSRAEAIRRLDDLGI